MLNVFPVIKLILVIISTLFLISKKKPNTEKQKTHSNTVFREVCHLDSVLVNGL